MAFGAAAPGAQAGHAQDNALAGHPSPYLALHARDPVHWQSWGEPVIDAARAQNKLLFVSVGYFSCHWCHVMQRESYGDEAIATLLNEGFLSVKIDRELQPALDAHLMEFVQATIGHGGWPLNVFLTPEGHPLVGFTYLPPDRFRKVLTELTERWQRDPDGLVKAASDVAGLLAKRRDAVAARTASSGDIERFARAFVAQASELADPLEGGFGNSQKFPSAPQLMTLVQMYAAEPTETLGDFLVLTLRLMASQGLRDQLGGGFFRYVTDPGWRVPHFEKMLYDNALLADLYLQAARVFGDPLLRDVAFDTLDFVLAELSDGGAGFASSLSAVDDRDIEGGYYLWSPESLDRLLDPPERSVATLAWGLRGPPALEAGYLPVQAAASVAAVAQASGLSDAEVRALVDSARRKLLASRAGRTAPRDDKRLAGWNGLVLSALSRASVEAGGERFAEPARRLRRYLIDELWTGEQLYRARAASGSYGDASLQDYAYVTRGIADFAQLLDEPGDWATVESMVEAGWRRFRTDAGWRRAESLLIPYGRAEAVLADGPMPSSSAVLTGVALRVARRTGNAALAERARTALEVVTDEMIESAFFHATHLQMLQRFGGPT